MAPIGLIVGAGALLGGALPAGARVADPPGNNGTIKVDELPFDDHPDNEPHVGCTFQVDLYGYDAGDLTATVLFEVVAPTGDAELGGGDLAIGGDAAGGGTDLDASGTYDLSAALAGYAPQPQQGWHVKLTVHAEGSQGADVKHKVFWVASCETPPSSTTSTSTTQPHGPTTSTPHGSTTTSTPHGSTTSTVPHGSTTSTPPGSGPSTTAPGHGPSTTTPGVSPSSPPTSAVSGSLPRTGTETGPLVATGVVLIAAGATALGVRRLRHG